MIRSPFSAVLVPIAVAIVCLSYLGSASASEPLRLFDEPVARTYTSKPPVLLPERAPGQPIDLFAARPSPSVAELKAMADRRKVDDDRVHAGACLPGGVVCNYQEAYRLHVKTGKPLAVLVGQSPHVIKAVGAEATNEESIVCVIEPGDEPQFSRTGIHRFYRPIPNAQPRGVCPNGVCPRE